MSQFTNSPPKNARELEIFYRETRNKLKDSDTTLEDLESVVWVLFAVVQQQVTKDDLRKLREDLEAQIIARA